MPSEIGNCPLFPKALALRALGGASTERLPVALHTWEHNYVWKVAGVAPWQLAFGSSETWHGAHMALLEHHQPDAIMYSGSGRDEAAPQLAHEDDERWIIRDLSSGALAAMDKRNLARVPVEEPQKGDSIGPDIRSLEDIEHHLPAPTGCGEAYLAGLRRLIKEVGERALVLPHHSPGYICACYALGFEQAMVMVKEAPALFLAVCDRYAEESALRMREVAEAGAEAVFIADSWASVDIISPAMFERFALPYQRAVVEAAHAAGLKVILHNSGNIIPLLEEEAALGTEGFAFEQPRKGCDLSVATVRGVFGPRRCLLGNLDSEGLLVRGNPREIAEAVAEQVRQSGQGAPFILCTGSPLPDDCPPEAVDVMVQAARSVT